MAKGVLIPGAVGVMHKSWYRLLRQELRRRKKLRLKQEIDELGDEDDTGLILPMDLMEKILAHVPFPDVFKARVLSRSWRRKFSQASQSGRPSYTLLNELSSAAAKWPTYCPVYMTPEGSLTGYNHISRHWEKIVISAYIPLNRTYSNLVAGREVVFGGPLICTYEPYAPFFCQGTSMLEIFVANMQTGSWKTILCPKQPETSGNPQVVLINKPGTEDYNILVYDIKGSKILDMVGGFEFEVHLFDSASGTWTSKQSSYIQAGNSISWYCASSRQVDADGNIFLMASGVMDDPPGYPLRNVVHVLKYNMLDDVWFMSTPMVQPRYLHVHNMGGMFHCGSKLLLITLVTNYPVRLIERQYPDFRTEKGNSYKLGACVYEVCPDTLQIDAVSASPMGKFSGICRRIMSDDNNIYFFCSNCPGQSKAIVVRYNVSEQNWDLLPCPPTDMCRNTIWARSAYTPGQNPFASV